MKLLQGKTVIITGASQGIGAAYALEVAKRGANVVAADMISCEKIVGEIKAAGGSAIDVLCDVTDSATVEAMVASAVKQYGAVHGLINNAALFTALPQQPFENISSTDFDRVMAVNVRGAFECMKGVSPVMRSQRYGKIVNIASGTVFKGTPMMMSYVSSKGAIVAMTRCAAREFGADGVRVNCLAPGLTASEGVRADEGWKIPMQSIVSRRCLKRDEVPEDLVGSACFLLSPDSDFMTGQTLVIDGGDAMH